LTRAISDWQNRTTPRFEVILGAISLGFENCIAERFCQLENARVNPP